MFVYLFVCLYRRITIIADSRGRGKGAPPLNFFLLFLFKSKIKKWVIEFNSPLHKCLYWHISTVIYESDVFEWQDALGPNNFL